MSVAVVKVGKEPADKAWVHAVSGGTITSQGVQSMLFNSLEPYSAFFLNLKAATPETNMTASEQVPTFESAENVEVELNSVEP